MFDVNDFIFSSHLKKLRTIILRFSKNIDNIKVLHGFWKDISYSQFSRLVFIQHVIFCKGFERGCYRIQV